MEKNSELVKAAVGAHQRKKSYGAYVAEETLKMHDIGMKVKISDSEMKAIYRSDPWFKEFVQNYVRKQNASGNQITVKEALTHALVKNEAEKVVKQAARR